MGLLKRPKIGSFMAISWRKRPDKFEMACLPCKISNTKKEVNSTAFRLKNINILLRVKKCILPISTVDDHK